MNHTRSNYTPHVEQDVIDRVCAGVCATPSERDAVWNYIRGLERTIEDLRDEARSDDEQSA